MTVIQNPKVIFKNTDSVSPYVSTFMNGASDFLYDYRAKYFTIEVLLPCAKYL
jgi:hypothetical protein